MYITASLFNIVQKQFEDVGLQYLKIPEEPTSKVDASFLGSLIETIVLKKNNNRIGLETGFNIPITVTGVIYKLYQNCGTLGELFEKSALYSPLVNTISKYSSKIEDELFFHEVEINREFISEYPIAARQLYEAQIGVSMQLFYSLTGKKIYPLKVFTAYKKEEQKDILEEYLNCPIVYGHNKLRLVFDKTILQLPILTASKELLPLMEKLIKSISYENQMYSLSESVKGYLMKGISTMELSLKSVAWRFNMSERNIQRKLKKENTSYQDILNNVRKELVSVYLHKNIPFSEIAFLLGFESQSAFNKFFKKHFNYTPSQLK
jgi:AraC-like DNA-binding protein